MNTRGKAFVNEWCNEKHTTTKRIPNEHFLLEEKQVLLPLPGKHYYKTALKKRVVSPDSFVSIDSNKYSVPVKYVGKIVYFRVIYGYRIDIYDKREDLILHVAAIDERKAVLANPEHYAPIAKKVSTSIPQIRRDFTEMFSNGALYLSAAGRKFDQPTFYARRIMELVDLYDINTLDAFIEIAVKEDKLDIRAFKSLLKDYNNGKRNIVINNTSPPQPLTRDCSYYENLITEVQHAGNDK